jgi:hypothetical protein
MRIPALAILTTVTVLTAAPTSAQTYSPNYPVCLQAYGRNGGYIECAYTSLAQCNQSASGRAAQCVINPYFASARREQGYWRYPRLLISSCGDCFLIEMEYARERMTIDTHGRMLTEAGGARVIAKGQ